MDAFEFQPKWLIREGFDGEKYQKPNSVFKYMKQKHIDNFFNSGVIKLGTFNSYKKTEDQNREDYQEGTNEYVVWNKDRSHKWTLRRMTGNDNLIFCTSTKEDLTTLGSRWDCDGYFEIQNSLGFAFEVAKSINGFKLGLEGPAIYTDSGQTNFYTELYKVDDFNKSTPVQELFKTFDLISKINLDLFFSKRTYPYKIESEYRFIWILDHEPTAEELIVRCPDARRFCKKIT